MRDWASRKLLVSSRGWSTKTMSTWSRMASKWMRKLENWRVKLSWVSGQWFLSPSCLPWLHWNLRIFTILVLRVSGQSTIRCPPSHSKHRVSLTKITTSWRERWCLFKDGPRLKRLDWGKGVALIRRWHKHITASGSVLQERRVSLLVKAYLPPCWRNNGWVISSCVL